ncbi:PIF1-like helicase-domain-containing protein [Flagelloscypha sp. PMI_526]|nr:PIF1-like helicase-domain-containing protein [Flagelloscypha sp. PMI_526]
MPKAKWYAVRKGREGPKIYDSWEQCRAATSRYPAAIHKSFTAKSEAEKWIQDFLNVPRPPVKSLPPPIDILDLPPLPVPTPVPQPLPAETPSVSLSPEQQMVLQRVLERKSVFFTGSAGKSVLLREIIRVLGGPRSPGLAITASTGIAGVNIGGCTLHSWAGIGLGKKKATDHANGLIHNKALESALHRWQNTQTLIIDEISMIDGRLFDKLENIARLVRRDDRPFGGITVYNFILPVNFP